MKDDPRLPGNRGARTGVGSSDLVRRRGRHVLNHLFGGSTGFSLSHHDWQRISALSGGVPGSLSAHRTVTANHEKYTKRIWVNLRASAVNELSLPASTLVRHEILLRRLNNLGMQL